MDTPVVIGTIYIIAAALGIALNSRTVWSIISKGKLRNNFSALFILFLQPLITDILFELIYLCYLAPSVIIQNNLIAHPLGGYLSLAIDATQSYCWLNNSLSQVSLAVDRFIVTVMLRPHLFTPIRAVLISIIQHLLAVSFAALQLILPCCSSAFSFANFGYRDVVQPGVPNYVFAYLNMPVKVSCSVIPIIVYCSIYIFVRASGNRFKLQSIERAKRRKQELRFAAQFASIAIVYIFSSFSFSLLKLLSIPSEIKWIQAFPVVFALISSTTNSIGYLLNERKKGSVASVSSSSFP